jgi:hypothetical protein
MGCNQDAGLQNCKMGAFVLRCVSGVACDLGRKMSAAQQAAAIPIEALKFSTRFNDKLTGGASSLSFQPKSGTTEAEGETEGSAQGGDAGPLVESEAVLAQVLSYDPLLIHKTEPWRRLRLPPRPHALACAHVSLARVPMGCAGRQSGPERLACASGMISLLLRLSMLRVQAHVCAGRRRPKCRGAGPCWQKWDADVERHVGRGETCCWATP